MRFSFKELLINLKDVIKDALIRLVNSRPAIMLTVICILASVLIGRLFYLQIVKSDYYNENFSQKSQKTISIPAARGNIYDCNGKLLAYNTLTYSVTITDEIPSSRTRAATLNGIINRAVKIIQENGDRLAVDFNIEIGSDGEYRFKENPVLRQTTFLINIFGVSSEELKNKGYDRYSAVQIMDELIDKYGVSEEYSKQETLNIVTVRYALSLIAYQKYVATTIATDISDATKSAILECTDNMTGVEIEEGYKRVYNNAQYYAHIIGYTGDISETELDELNISNLAGIEYSANDIVGKAGVEQSYDSYLQGRKGSRTVFVDSTGNILDVIEETESAGGNDLYLSIDTELQIAAYNILEKKLAACLLNKLVEYDYKSTEEKQTYVYIPVKDVYHKMLTNIADIDHFYADDATAAEKNILALFEIRRADAVAFIEREMRNADAPPVGQLSDDLNEYMYYVYDMLGTEGILDKSSMDTTSGVYLRWQNEECSLREFLQNAIAENWINISGLLPDGRYSDSDQVYEEIVVKTMELLQDDKKFDENVYYYMIFDGEISPYDVIDLVYSQGKLEPDKVYEELTNGRISPFVYVQNEIRNLVLTPAMLALDPCSGALCITDVHTGKVKALVSYPTYDNNMLSGHVDPDYWYWLNHDDSQPLFDVATQALTPPGSTFKLCTAVAGLAEGYITPDTYINDEVYFEKVTPAPKCYIAPASHGFVNVSTALEGSCNYFFFEIGYDMGLDEGGEYNSLQALNIITEYAKQLGLGIKSGVEIRESEPRVSTTDSVRTAIGQGTNGFATVHMARYVNTIASSGKDYKLSLIDKVVDKHGNTVLSVEPVIENEVELSNYEWDSIHYGMRLVTQSGTASSFFTSLGATIAGKTGTAEENLYRSNHAAFVGYAPYENPEVSFACMIRNCDSTSYPGDTLCQTLRYYFNEISFSDVIDAPVENTISGFHSE